MDSSPHELDLSVDTGGTFTDVVARRGDGERRRVKVPSTPDNPARAVRQGADAILDILPGTITRLRHGTTVATNALLEARGANTLFITTAGFEDLLYLRRQNRPNIYALAPTVPPPLVDSANTLGLRERTTYDGAIIEPVEPLQAFIERHLASFANAESVAICLLHAYANPTHERALGAALEAIHPHLNITLSSELVPLTREYERALTTVANAFVAPRMQAYLEDLSALFPHTDIAIMDSAGGLIPVDDAAAEPVRTALSGPAGGVRGARRVADQLAAGSILALDMGGTSTDISIIERTLLPSSEGRVGHLPLRTPMLPIETVGAGGGSIAFIDDGGILKVGPQSAGALPGPAAYGLGGAHATVTDAHVVLGRLPSLLGGEMDLDAQAAHAAVEAIARKLDTTIEQAALGIVEIATANIVRACKRILMERGVDPRTLSLVAFGGAGGLHACDVARELGCCNVIFPTDPGVLSAEGILHAPRQVTLQQALYSHESSMDTAAIAERILSLLERASESLEKPQEASYRVLFEIRYAGQTHALPIALPDVGSAPFTSSRIDLAHLRGAFDQAHQDLFGWQLDASSPIETTAIRVLAEAACSKANPIRVSDGFTTVTGPQAVSTYSATLWVPEGWQVEVSPNRAVTCERIGASAQHPPRLTQALELEIHRQRLVAIAEEMGAALMRSSFSANIKERRDFSCALFDHQGNMLVQAAHIPVHLGSQPLSVRAAIAAGPIANGQHILLNDPYAGGTHLPDLTLVSPVYLPGNSQCPLFYVANRAHHADIGGLTPGSMPAPFDSEGNPRPLTIHDEGFRISPTPISEELRKAFADASRTPRERYGDLRAQEAANHVGMTRLQELCSNSDAAQHITPLNQGLLDYAERRMRAIIAPIADGTYHFEDVLDSDGLSEDPIAIPVTLTISGTEALVDFTEAPGTVQSSVNAVRAITLAAVHYVFRCLGPDDLPTSSGLTRPLSVRTSPGTIVDATYPAAVSAGNVETSQRLVDLLMGALDRAQPGLVPAASSGSMNNILFGGVDTRPGPSHNDNFVHYETLAGGSGATSMQSGADGIHTHMTNTLNTPIEELERIFPVRITRYALRPANPSQDSSLHAGGRGIERHYTFLAPAAVTLLTERRTSAPYGLNGGAAGACGANQMIRQDGRVEALGGQAFIMVESGDTIAIATPGGGAYGQHED